MPKIPKCIQCGNEIKFRYLSTQKTCSINCQLEYNRENPEKVKSFLRTLEEREWKQKKKVMKEKLKKLSDYEAEARRVFQRWIRERDKDLPCISCDSVDSPIWDAGHFLKAELYSGMIFDPDNVHKQCRKCNYYLDGNELGYRDGLIKRHGAEFVARIDARKDKLRTYKYSKQELINIKNQYAERLRDKA